MTTRDARRTRRNLERRDRWVGRLARVRYSLPAAYLLLGVPAAAVAQWVGATFAPPATIAVGTRPKAVAAGDFNRDSKTDLAVANSQANSIAVLYGDGSGNF